MALEPDFNWPGLFHKEAARILIEAKAHVNAVNGRGESYLNCARLQVDLIKLLISKEAKITSEGLLATINAENL